MDTEKTRARIDLHREIIQDLHKEAHQILSRLTKRLDRDYTQINECLDVLSSGDELDDNVEPVLDSICKRLRKLSDSGGRNSRERLSAMIEYLSELRGLLAKVDETAKSQDLE